MRAAYIDQYGPPDNLKIGELEVPNPGVDEVLIKVNYASINPIDYKIRRGDLLFLVAPKFPRVPGCDFSGTVLRTGRNVHALNPGDSVFGMCNPMKSQFGSYAEMCIAAASSTVRRPHELSDAQAASLPVAGLTALKSLKYMIKLKPGDSIFINGASGGVGSFAVQIAKVLGARIAASCSAANMDFVKALGAEEVYDYRSTDVTRIKDKFDGFFDASAKLSFPRVQKLLTKTGVYVTTVPDIETTPFLLLTRALPGRKAHVVLAGSGPLVSEELSELAEMVVQGQIKPVLQETIALAQIAQGHLSSEKEHAAGKTVVRIDSE